MGSANLRWDFFEKTSNIEVLGRVFTLNPKTQYRRFYFRLFIASHYNCYDKNVVSRLFVPIVQYRGRGGMSSSVMAGCATGGVLGLRGE